MILTASKPVNARIGKPSVNAPNPRFLIEGDKVVVSSRVLGDNIVGNSEWIFTEDREFFTTEGFHITQEFKAMPFFEHLDKVPLLFKSLEISKLWNISKGENVKVGIIDDGVARGDFFQCQVTELNKNSIPSNDISSHGTAMGCIIAGLNEKNGILGIAPKIDELFSYTIDIDSLTPNVLTKALDAMIKSDVDIINLSFVVTEQIFSFTSLDAVVLQEKINDLTKEGCIIVCATGNDFARNQNFYPAKYKNVISVAGLNNAGNLDIASNLWSGVSLCMPSSQYYPQLSHSNGTSSAAALTSGCLACVYRFIKEKDKTSAFMGMLSAFALSSSDDNPQIQVPKFNTDIFLKNLKL